MIELVNGWRCVRDGTHPDRRSTMIWPEHAALLEHTLEAYRQGAGGMSGTVAYMEGLLW